MPLLFLLPLRFPFRFELPQLSRLFGKMTDPSNNLPHDRDTSQHVGSGDLFVMRLASKTEVAAS